MIRGLPLPDELKKSNNLFPLSSKTSFTHRPPAYVFEYLKVTIISESVKFSMAKFRISLGSIY
jgi:hypothetical protein